MGIHHLIWLYAFFIPFELVMNFEYGTWLKVYACVVAVWWVLTGRLPRERSFPEAKWVVGWLGIAFLSTLISGVVRPTAGSNFLNAGFALIIVAAMRNHRYIQRAMLFYITGAAASCLVVFFAPQQAEDRLRGVAGQDPNYYGVWLSMGAVATGYFLLSPVSGFRNLGWRIALAGTLLLLAWGIGATGSRGAWVALAVGTLALLLTMGLELRRALNMVLVGGALWWMVWEVIIHSRILQDRLQSGLSGETSHRLDAWLVFWRLHFDAPFLGVGLGNSCYVAAPKIALVTGIWKEKFVAHSTPLAVLTETGWIGFILFGVAIVSPLWALVRAGRWRQNAQAICFYVTLLTGSLSLNMDYYKGFWFAWALVTAEAALVRRRSVYGSELPTGEEEEPAPRFGPEAVAQPLGSAQAGAALLR